MVTGPLPMHEKRAMASPARGRNADEGGWAAGIAGPVESHPLFFGAAIAVVRTRFLPVLLLQARGTGFRFFSEGNPIQPPPWMNPGARTPLGRQA